MIPHLTGVGSCCVVSRRWRRSASACWATRSWARRTRTRSRRSRTSRGRRRSSRGSSASPGRDEEAVGEAARRYGYEYATTDWRELVADDRIGLFDNGGPNSLHAEPTIAAAEAGKHVICEKPLGRDADESYDIWRRVAATGVKHLCAFNYRFVPAVRLAREMIEAGELGEIRHFRGRYLQDWARRPDARHVALRSRRGRLGRARRPRHARDRPGALPERRDRVGLRVREDVPARAEGRRRDRGRGRVRERRGRHDRVDAARARPPQRVPVGDQRLEGLARVRHGAPERAAGVPRRRRPRARLQDRARLARPTTRSGSTGGRPATSSAGATRSCTSCTTCCRRSRRTATSRRTARRSRTATARPRSWPTRSSAPAQNGHARAARLPLALGREHERRLAAAVGERLGEAVERHTQADERLECARPPLACAVERVDAGEPVLPVRVDAAEERRGSRGSRRSRARGPSMLTVCVAAVDARAGRRRRCGGAARGCPPSPARRAASTTRSKPPTSSRARPADVGRREVARAEAAVAGVVARLEPAVQTSMPASRSRYVESMPIAPAPSTSARSSCHGWRPPIARACLIARAQIDVGSASTPSRPSERGIGDQLRGVLGDELAREAVEPGDAALAVVASEARVGRSFLAGEAVGARAAHGCGHEVAAGEAVAVALDDAEQLVAEHELGVAVRRHAEEPSEISRSVPHTPTSSTRSEHLAGAGLHLRHLGDARRVGDARLGDERLHGSRQAAVNPPSITRGRAGHEGGSLGRQVARRPRRPPRVCRDGRAAGGRAARRSTRPLLRPGGEPTASRRCRDKTAFTRMPSLTWSTASARVSEDDRALRRRSRRRGAAARRVLRRTRR